MASFNNDMKNVTISMDDSNNDEMLTVSFNQCTENDPNSQESSQPQNSVIGISESQTEIVKQASNDAADGHIESTEVNTSLPSASQYFTSEDSSPKRNRTTSDNEFFDHLAAGDTAMMSDENVNETVTSNIIANTSTVDQSLKHCDSAAKLNVTEDDSEPIKSNVSSPVQEAINIKSSEEDFKTKSEEADDSVKNEENIPVFRYFANDSKVEDQQSESAFDSFATLSCNVVDGKAGSADAFSSAIEESEANRRRDAWIPSLATQEYFNSVFDSETIRKSFTNPQLILKNMLTDPVSALITSQKLDDGTCNLRKANIPREDTVPDNEIGLKMLMDKGCHRAAINLTRKLILRNTDGSRLTPQLLQLWFCRLGLLIKTKLFNEAYEESVAFSSNLDKPDLYYKFYPDFYNGRDGSMVPFGFRLLIAEIPRYVGKYQEALSRLYSLLNVIQKILKNLEDGLSEDGTAAEMSDANRKASKNLWHERELNTLYSLINAVSSHKDYSLAICLINNVIQIESENKKPHLWSAKGRIHLQLGDIGGAQESFNSATSSIPEKLKDQNEYLLMDLMNKAMLSIAQNNFHDAYVSYESASKIDPSNPTIKNNMAVCLLYKGKMRESLATLGKEIEENPNNFLHEGILFNVCTLYELESSQSTLKKSKMLSLVSQHKGDTFNTACLKIA